MTRALHLTAGARAMLLVLAGGAAAIAAPYAQSQTVLATPTVFAAQEAPAAKEKNPPGDIPDDQVFVAYASPLGFALQVPEGWARSDAAEGVTFADKYGQISAGVKPAAGPLTLASVRANEAAELEKTGHAVKISGVSAVTLPAGAAVKIVYSANSEANPVTGKKIRLECERFLLRHGDKVATLTFSSPAGADNVDQWVLISQSFAWQ